MDRMSIAFRYLQGWFWVDIVSAMPLQRLLERGFDIRFLRSTKMLKLTKTLRLLRVSKMNELIEKMKDVMGEQGALALSLFKLLFMLMAAATLMACGWWYITTSFVSNRFGALDWTANQGFEDMTKVEIFIACLYFALTIATTVGFGDIAGCRHHPPRGQAGPRDQPGESAGGSPRDAEAEGPYSPAGPHPEVSRGDVPLGAGDEGEG
mmetsp:Transcript_137429/g.310205  ORF Transcript_137429/g.310205 Transcript_137429/m.310205 type:complete len:208 (+) Transcript_137429:1-624(+)